jgi:hypothetical protein
MNAKYAEYGEVRERQRALSEIIDVKRFVNNVFTQALLAGATWGGIVFLGQLIFLFMGRMSFQVVAALTLLSFVFWFWVFIGHSISTALDREIRRRTADQGPLPKS